MFAAAYFLFVYETRKWAPLLYRCNPVGIHRRVGVNSRVMLASMPQPVSLTHTAMAVAIAARPFSSSVLTLTRPRPKWVTLNPLASYSPQPTSSSAAAAVSGKLILYSKPGCCLCDGLKEKLHAAFALSSPDSLHHVDLQVRDITTNPEWERAYQYEIPVLARVRWDGTEEVLPRLSPRLGVELIQKKIAAALRQ